MLYMDLLGLYWPKTKSEVNIIQTGPYITYWHIYGPVRIILKCIFSFHEQRYMYHFPIITIWYLLKSIGCTRLECGRLCVRVPIGSNKDIYMDLLGLYWPKTKSEINIFQTGPYIAYSQSKKFFNFYITFAVVNNMAAAPVHQQTKRKIVNWSVLKNFIKIQNI
jgi:hypothetical protein